MKIGLDKIIYRTGTEVKFPYRIKKTFSKNNNLIVILEIPSNETYNENVYCFDENGQLKWQIIKQDYLYEKSSFVNVREDSNGNVWLVNWDGSQYMIDVNSGKVLNKEFFK